MQSIFDWLNEEIEKVEKKIPDLLGSHPDSFKCGYEIGYRDCLLNLEHFLFIEETN